MKYYIDETVYKQTGMLCIYDDAGNIINTSFIDTDTAEFEGNETGREYELVYNFGNRSGGNDYTLREKPMTRKHAQELKDREQLKALYALTPDTGELKDLSEIVSAGPIVSDSTAKLIAPDNLTGGEIPPLQVPELLKDRKEKIKQFSYFANYTDSVIDKAEQSNDIVRRLKKVGFEQILNDYKIQINTLKNDYNTATEQEEIILECEALIRNKHYLYQFTRVTGNITFNDYNASSPQHIIDTAFQFIVEAYAHAGIDIDIPGFHSGSDKIFNDSELKYTMNNIQKFDTPSKNQRFYPRSLIEEMANRLLKDSDNNLKKYFDKKNIDNEHYNYSMQPFADYYPREVATEDNGMAVRKELSDSFQFLEDIANIGLGVTNE